MIWLSTKIMKYVFYLTDTPITSTHGQRNQRCNYSIQPFVTLWIQFWQAFQNMLNILWQKLARSKYHIKVLELLCTGWQCSGAWEKGRGRKRNHAKACKSLINRFSDSEHYASKALHRNDTGMVFRSCPSTISFWPKAQRPLRTHDGSSHHCSRPGPLPSSTQTSGIR